MGVLTLANFRTELESAMGSPGFDTTRTDRWINFAYLDIATAIDFDIFDDDVTASTVDTQNYVTLATDGLAIKLVRNETAGDLLTWVRKPEYFRLGTTAGTPKKWTRHGNKILLYPVPNAVISILAVVRKPPSTLSLVGDVTEIPAQWDVAVHLLSVHYGFMGIGELDRAMLYLQRAGAYIQTRLTEQDMTANLEGLGMAKSLTHREPIPMQR